MLLWTWESTCLYKSTDFIPYRYILGRGISVSFGSSISHFLNDIHIVFHNSYTNLHSCHSYKRIFFLLDLCYHMFLFIFWKQAIFLMFFHMTVFTRATYNTFSSQNSPSLSYLEVSIAILLATSKYYHCYCMTVILLLLGNICIFWWC